MPLVPSSRPRLSAALRGLLVAVVAAATVMPAAGAQEEGGGFDPEAYFSSMRWRNIGPTRGGRSVAVAGVVQDPQTYYFGSTGGGLWKTTDGGTTWGNV